jgi:chromosome segregation ATPase
MSKNTEEINTNEDIKKLYTTTDKLSDQLSSLLNTKIPQIKEEQHLIVKGIDSFIVAMCRGDYQVTDNTPVIKTINQKISDLSDRINKLEKTNITLTKHVHATESNLQFLYDAFTHVQSVLTCSSSWIKSDVSELSDLAGENVDLGMDNTGW